MFKVAMMAYRQIHTQIWKDTWFLDLEPQEKLLFIYLFSNDNTNLIGLYEISLKIIAFETGLDMQTVKACFDKFQAAGKVVYEGGYLWVVNLRRYNENRSPHVLKRIEFEISQIPSTPLKIRYQQANNMPIDSIDTVSPPYDEKMPLTIQYNTVSKADSGANAPRATDPAPKPARQSKPKPPTDPLLAHQAIIAYKDVAHLSVPQAMRQEVAETVGWTDGNDALWRKVIRDWIGHGWNPRNLTGMLEAYRAGGIASKNGRGKRDEPASYPALRRSWERDNGPGTFPPDLGKEFELDSAIDVEVKDAIEK